jgi:hypothetical protein
MKYVDNIMKDYLPKKWYYFNNMFIKFMFCIIFFDNLNSKKLNYLKKYYLIIVG